MILTISKIHINQKQNKTFPDRIISQSAISLFNAQVDFESSSNKNKKNATKTPKHKIPPKNDLWC
jgi:hypothetical protein